MFSRFLPICFVALAGGGTSRVGAQNSARVQLNDKHLSCGQIYPESRQIDQVSDIQK